MERSEAFNKTSVINPSAVLSFVPIISKFPSAFHTQTCRRVRTQAWSSADYLCPTRCGTKPSEAATSMTEYIKLRKDIPTETRD